MDEFDDLENPEVTELLQRWGKSVRRSEDATMKETPVTFAAGKPFLPPDDLSRLHRALDEVDGEIDASGAPASGASPPCAPAPGLARRLRQILRVPWYVPVMAIAALLMLVVGGWNLLYPVRHQPPLGGIVAAITVSDLRLTLHGRRLRAGRQTQFHSGQELDIHVDTDTGGFAVLAMLDRSGVFSAVRNGGVFAVGPGTVALDGQIRLDEHTGTESLVIIAAKTELELTKIDEIIARAQAAIESGLIDHERKLRAVLRSLRKERGLCVTEFTFEHLP